jgi:hypothetical protein
MYCSQGDRHFAGPQLDPLKALVHVSDNKPDHNDKTGDTK